MPAADAGSARKRGRDLEDARAACAAGGGHHGGLPVPCRDVSSLLRALPSTTGPGRQARYQKGLLRSVGVDPPRLHDVADVLEAERARLPAPVLERLGELSRASRSLRRDRELAFHGAEDLTPSDFYRKSDASEARTAARLVVETVVPCVPDSR